MTVETSHKPVLLDGKATAREIRMELAAKVQKAVAAGKAPPHLGAILVGDDGASETYVSGKIKACEESGIRSTLKKFPAGVSEQELLEFIRKWNNDDDITGFIVQLPLPSHINSDLVTETINPDKDVDGFHPVNVGKLTLGLPSLVPATPLGIMTLLDRYKIPTSGKHAVVIGRSNIVGTPMALLLSRNSNPGNCTVTLTHSRTKNLEEYTRKADIIIAALGKPGFLKADMVKEGSIVVDVGITRVKDPTKASGFRLSGDVDYDAVSQKCSYITPVPGGVGPMTIASLLINTCAVWEKNF